MYGIISIAHPFQTVEEFQQLVGCRLSELMHRLASKYPRLLASCGVKRMLLAVSVAWGLSGAAKAGNVDAFAHIDDALQPPVTWGCVKAPPGGCVMVEGEPFFISEGEQGMLRFLWDGFAIFIDHEGCGRVRQEFFDLADLRQSKAYAVMGECLEEPNNQECQQENHQEYQQENKEDIQQENKEDIQQENKEDIQARRSTAKNCSADNPSRENISQERISQENYSNGTPFTANCKQTNCKQTNCKQTNCKQTNCKQVNPLTFKEIMLCQIAYVCDIDLVKPEQVETLKDQLEYLLDSPLAAGLSSDDILLISKKIRCIKPCRLDRKKAREAEQKQMEAKYQFLAMKAAISAGVGVTNNFNGPIGQWIASVGEVTYDK